MFPDPSLTPWNLSTVLDSMSDEQWERFGRYANIPDSELVRIRRQYSSEREKKEAVIHSLTSTHPAQSWTRVAHALYRTAWAWSDESCLRALDRLQQLFPIGTVYMCSYMYIYVQCITSIASTVRVMEKFPFRLHFSKTVTKWQQKPSSEIGKAVSKRQQNGDEMTKKMV